MQLDVIGQQRPQTVPIPLVEQRDITRHRSGRRPRVRKRVAVRVDLPEMRATPRQVGFHRVDRKLEEGGDLYQRFVEDVLQDDDTALESGELDKARHGGFDRSLCINISRGSGCVELTTSAAASIGSAMRTSRLRSRSSARL